MKKPIVSRRFSEDQREFLKSILPSVLDAVMDVADEAELIVEDWPRRISPMTTKEIRQDRDVGGGHGVYLEDTQEIRLNATMPDIGLYTNLIHELWHHVDPDAGEAYINDRVVPLIYRMVEDQDLDPKEWSAYRGHQDEEEEEGDDEEEDDDEA